MPQTNAQHADLATWRRTPRLQKAFPQSADYLRNQETTRRTLAACNTVMTNTQHADLLNAAPIVEVSPEESQMIQRADAIFAASPGLKQTYKTADAFGRHCLNTCREGRNL